jgi:hypothetical protein
MQQQQLRRLRRRLLRLVALTFSHVEAAVARIQGSAAGASCCRMSLFFFSLGEMGCRHLVLLLLPFEQSAVRHQA